MAVTLNEFTRPNCQGSKRLCANINPNVCCRSKPRAFASGTCQGCTSTDIQLSWKKVGSNYCGRNAVSTNGGHCIGGGSNLRGHSWCRLCRTARARALQVKDGVADVEEREAESEVYAPAAKCTSSVEPNLATIDGKRFFKINHDVPYAESEALNNWLDGDNPTYETLPAHLLQYEVPFNATLLEE